MGTLLNLQYPTNDGVSVFNIQDINSSFALGSLKVMYTGQNRNGSSISKEAVTSALPSLKNVPIVCHYDYKTNEIGGHDVEVVKADDGGIKLRNLTTPIGVVPATATYQFENMEDDTGTEREYLVVNGVILWKRQEAYAHIANDLGGKVGHSMEISIKDGEMNKDTGVYAIKNFEFTALCLLESVTPCFQGSELELFSAADFKQQMEDMMAELKDSLMQINPSEPQGFDINFEQNPEEGGKKALDYEAKMALIEEYGLNLDELDFAINDYTVEELREKFEAMKAQEPAPAEDAEEEEKMSCKRDEDDDEDKQKFELNRNIEGSLREAIHGLECVSRPWGPEPRYWMVDFDAEKSEVYVEDETERKLFAMSYAVNGDAVAVDADSKKRMKWAIVEYDEGEQVLPFSHSFEVLEAKYTELAETESDWSEKYQAASETISSLTADNESLRQFKENIETAAAQAQRDELFELFEDLIGVEAFEELREHAADYSIESLEEKCYAIRGRMGAQAKFSLESKAPVIKVAAIKDPKYAPYGGIVEYYEGKK